MLLRLFLRIIIAVLRLYAIIKKSRKRRQEAKSERIKALAGNILSGTISGLLVNAIIKWLDL